MQLDTNDLTILAAIQQNCRISLETLSEQCSLSVPSVQRRLKRLRDHKVISSEVAIINPDKVGFDMTFIVQVELEREALRQLDEFRKHVNKEPRVQQCYYVTGDADFVLICTAKNMRDFEDLTHQLFFDNANVRRFKTSVVMDRAKVGLEVPV
ncbi:MAG: Lrp/AsnC family transcriptional regulator [Gammaproteobacteria bacterium]|jgi:DNA-binding Lrp family transcriptional regulator|nr:Lrp/AsnC family transcriptional regulator [Gammaproteobacteria bacterium]